MSEHPFDRVAAALRDRGYLRGNGCRELAGFKLRARCPGHSDRRASLSVAYTDGKVLLNCFAGCKTGDVIGALGLKMADLFGADRSTAAAPTIVSEYDYIDRNGVLVAQKVRYSNKTMPWRRPGDRPGTWAWGLDGIVPGLYRLPEVDGVHRVYLVEGEKAADKLWSFGLPATCPPYGANRWDANWSRLLLDTGCAEIIILPDADRPGDRHAERAAASLAEAAGPSGPGVKVVRLSGLQRGADVFDWLTGGHTHAELEIVAQRATWWTPDAKERERVERRREQTRVRVARHRERQREDQRGAAIPNVA